MLCKCLNIHHSVYYYHCNHTENSYHIANRELDIKIKKIYDESKGRYGSPKITKVLNKLKVHGIIKKVNNSSKYYLTTNGRKIINSILIFKNIQLPELYST